MHTKLVATKLMMISTNQWFQNRRLPRITFAVNSKPLCSYQNDELLGVIHSSHFGELVTLKFTFLYILGESNYFTLLQKCTRYQMKFSPVKMVDRLGEQLLTLVKALLKILLLRANLSILGVLIASLPRQPNSRPASSASIKSKIVIRERSEFCLLRFRKKILTNYQQGVLGQW